MYWYVVRLGILINVIYVDVVVVVEVVMFVKSDWVVLLFDECVVVFLCVVDLLVGLWWEKIVVVIMFG